MRPNCSLMFGVVAAAVLVGCNPPKPPAPEGAAASKPAAPAPAPIPIATVKLEKRAVQRTIEQPGTVHAFEETILYPKVPGFVATIAADPAKAKRPEHDRSLDIGSRVEAGQLLAELAVPELNQDLVQKEALIRQAEAEVLQCEKAAVAAEAAVEASKSAVDETRAALARAQALFDRWQSESTRVAQMVTDGVIDAQTKDETLNQAKAAAATRAEAVAKVASAESAVRKMEADRAKSAADIVAAKARLDVAQADRARVVAMLSYLKITAPYAGVITRRAINRGDFVTADGKQGLFVLAKTDPVRVVIQVPEADAWLVSQEQSVQLSLQAFPGQPMTGKVTRTSWALEPGSRTLRVEIDLPNPKGDLRPGMYAYARLAAELPADWAVPAAAVVKLSDEMAMYLAEADKAVRVVPQLGRGDAQYTQVLRYRRLADKDWTAVTGTEVFLAPAAAVTDGQPLPKEPASGVAR